VKIVPRVTVIAQDFETRVRCFNTRLRRSSFLVNARKARRVKRLCGSFAADSGSL
jgi:hypothetical protein